MVRRKVILPSWNVPEQVATDVNALKEKFTDFSTGEIVINTTPENVTLSTLDLNGNLSTFIGERKVSEMISNTLDTSNYATEEFVKESIANAQLGGEGGEIDLSEYAKKTDIPSLDGYATEEFVADEIAKIEIPSIEGLATKEETEAIKTWVDENGLKKCFFNKLELKAQMGPDPYVESGTVESDVYEEIKKSDVLILSFKYIENNFEVIEELGSINKQTLIINDQINTIFSYDLKELFVYDINYNIKSVLLFTIGENNNVIYYYQSSVGKDFNRVLLNGKEVAVKNSAVNISGVATEEWVGQQGFITEHQDITGKQDVIEDLESIREGASKGATALQEVPEGYATEAWVGEQGFLTEHQDISHLTTKDEFSKIFDEGDSDKTIRKIANEELASQLILSSATESMNELKEIAAWIQSHPEDAAAMNLQIVALQESAHTHENKNVLDGITSDDINKWNEPHEYLPLSGGSLTENGYIKFSGGGFGMKIFPEEDARMAIGGPSNRFADVYSEYFYGTLQGVSYSANTVPFSGIPTGTTSETVAVGNHTHEYLPLSGGTINGALSTSPRCNIIPTNDGIGTIGSLSNKYGKVYSYDIISDDAHLNKLTLSTKSDINTDIIRINNTDENSGFGYTFRYIGAGQGNDNALSLYSDEYKSGPLFRILQDGRIVGNNLGDNAVKTLVTSAKTSAIASTVPFSGLPIGTTSETVAVGNHEHEIYATKTDLNDVKDRVTVLETEHNTLVLEKDKKFSPIDEIFNLGPLMSLNDVTPYFILKNGIKYSIENLNTWNANFGIEEGSFGLFSTRIECKPIEVENKYGNDVILVSVVSANTKYIDSNGVTKDVPFGVLGIKNRTITINNETYNPNCILEVGNTFKITVPSSVTSTMEEFRKETITIGTGSNLEYFTPEKIWKEVTDNRGIVNVFEFRTPYFKTGNYGDSNLFAAKYNLKLDSLPNTNVSNEYGVVIDKIKYHHDLILPESPKIGKKIEILNNSLYGHKILANGKNITFSFDGSRQMIDGDIGIENSNKIVTCISDGEDWYIYKNM